ncbi:MAG: hypothetical protein RBT47_08290, partial [Anaerolineae bacterium]|nr:hypothetical protein [Anaerolineae bacterium]
MNAPIDWLLEGEPWIVYRTRRDLLGQPEEAPEVMSAREAMLADARVQALVAELSGWPGTVIASHRSASQPFHKLNFLADLGLTAADPGMDTIIGHILEHQSAEGPFQLPLHDSTGREQWAWALCDAPLIVYALMKFGLRNDPAVDAAIVHLVGLLQDNGWPCVVSKEIDFRGPGRKDDPCPFATLAMLKALAEIEGPRNGLACRTGGDALLTLW